MSRMLHELSAKDVPEIGGDTFSFLNQFPCPFFFHGVSRIKISCWDTFSHLFSSFIILFQSRLPTCLIKLINYCFGRGPHCNAAGAVSGWKQNSSLLQLFLKMGLDAPSGFRSVLLQNPFLLQPICWISPKWKATRAGKDQAKPYLFSSTWILMIWGWLWPLISLSEQQALCLWLFQNYFLLSWQCPGGVPRCFSARKASGHFALVEQSRAPSLRTDKSWPRNGD